VIQQAIKMVTEGENMNRATAANVMHAIMKGETTPAQISGLLVGLRMKGETVDEITGFAEAMRSSAALISPRSTTIVDTCGTGGDAAGTFNISTTAAIVAAACGVTIAKHGNRSVSSKCGSADVLEALGVRIDVAPADVEKCVNEIGIGFLYAPVFHPAMKHAVGPRREIGVRTVFNVLGPLTNPARATAQVLGVYDPQLIRPMARVLKLLGVKQAFVVHGNDNYDEFSITGNTRVAHLLQGRIEEYTVDPVQLGLARAAPYAIAGGTATRNAAIIRSVLSGEKGPSRDVVLLNAAAALVAGDLADTLAQGLSMAAKAIDDGRAMRKLQQLIDYTQRCAS